MASAVCCGLAAGVARFTFSRMLPCSSTTPAATFVPPTSTPIVRATGRPSRISWSPRFAVPGRPPARHPPARQPQAPILGHPRPARGLPQLPPAAANWDSPAASRDQTSRDQTSRDQASRDQTLRDQASRDQASRDQASRDQASRDQASRDQASQDQASQDQASQDQASQDQAS